MKTYKNLINFIKEKEVKRELLMTWLTWWHERISRWSKAYRPLFNAPTTNQSEAVVSTYNSRGSCRLSLADAA